MKGGCMCDRYISIKMPIKIRGGGGLKLGQV